MKFLRKGFFSLVVLGSFIIILSSPSPVFAQSACSGDISVTNINNSIEFRSSNSFDVSVTNSGSSPVTVDITDELWHDSNCNGTEDRLECTSVGLSQPCDYGTTNVTAKTWTNVPLQPGESKTMSWSSGNLIPGYCFIHSIYTSTTPLDNTNTCWKGFSQSWQEAQAGNLKYKYSQGQFSVNSSLPLVNGTAYGVNTHLDFLAVTNGTSVQNLANFKKDIDQLSLDSTKLKLLRLGIQPWDIVTFATQNSITWNEANLSQIDQAIDHALNKGFNIILTLYPWDNSCAWNPAGTPNCHEQDYLEAPYNDYLTRYYSYLANRWKGKIYAWSPWSEVDGFCFTSRIGQCKTKANLGYDSPPNYTSSDEYLNGLNSAFATIRTTIKSIDPNTLLIAHTANYPIATWYYRSIKIFDKIKDNLDALGTSLYATAQSGVDQMPNVLDFLRNRYNKPVFVIETGRQEAQTGNNLCPPANTEPEPRTSLILGDLAKINKHATGANFYQMRDDLSNSYECSLYGLRRTDDSLKLSYSSFINFINTNGIVLVTQTFGDINSDGKVDILDLARIVNKRTASSVPVPGGTPEDLDGNNFVDGADLQLFLTAYTQL